CLCPSAQGFSRCAKWGIIPAGIKGRNRMEESRACLHCYRLDGKGGGEACDPLSLDTGSDDTVWIHLNGRHADTKKILRDDFGLEPLLAKSMLAEETRPRLEETEQGTLLILRGINHNPGPEPEDLVSIRLWLV